MVTSFTVIFLTGYELNLPPETGHQFDRWNWTPVLFWILFSMIAPRMFLEGRCFLLTAPWSLCILNTKWHYFLDVVKLKGHKGAALLQAPFFFSVQFSSVQSLSRVRLCNPMNHSTPGLPVHHQLPEFTHTHVHRVDDAIQPSHSLSSPSPPAPNPSQHQSLFQWVNSSHEVAKVLEFQL